MWNDIITFWSTQVNPILTTLLATVLPIVTPYVASRVSSKFTDLKGLITTSLATVVSDVTLKFTNLSDRVDKLATRLDNFDNQVSRQIAPVIEKQDAILGVLLAVADNSRIPTEVKDNIKLLYSQAEASINTSNALLISRDSEIDKLKEELAQSFKVNAELKTQLDNVYKEAKATISKKSKKVTTKAQTW